MEIDGEADIRKRFNQYSTRSKIEWESIWENSIFILDANVLLNLHRYNETTSNDLIRVFEHISDKLWIPFQVALEYYENLESVTIEQINQYEKVKNILRETTKKIKDDLDNLDLDKRHSRINVEYLLDQIGNAIGDFQINLDELRKIQPDHHKRLHQKLEKLLEDKVGPALKSQEDLNSLYKDAEERYKQKRPPGFMDTEKSKNKSNKTLYFNNDICYQCEYGDAIVWFQIIAEAKKRNAKSMIFVTDDYKEDWWRISGGQKRGPRYELIDEIQSKAGVEFFHLYSSDSFLEFANQKYKIEVDEDSIQQIKKVTKSDTSSSIVSKKNSNPEQKVLDWVIQTNSESQIVISEMEHYWPAPTICTSHNVRLIC